MDFTNKQHFIALKNSGSGTAASSLFRRDSTYDIGIYVSTNLLATSTYHISLLLSSKSCESMALPLSRKILNDDHTAWSAPSCKGYSKHLESNGLVRRPFNGLLGWLQNTAQRRYFYQLTVLSATYNLNFLCCDFPSLLQQTARNHLLNLSRHSFLLP